MSKKNEQENGQVQEAPVQVVFTSQEEAEKNPRHGTSKTGEKVEWDLFTIEAVEDIKKGTQLFAWAGGGGVALGLVASTLGVRVFKTHGGRKGGGTVSTQKILSQWDTLPEEEKEKLRAKVREDEKAKKAAGKKGKKEQLEEATV